MSTQGSVRVTHEGDTDNTECRIHFTFLKGFEGDRIDPPDGDETEFDRLEVLTVADGRMVWRPYPGPDRGEPDLREWARSWLDENPDEVAKALEPDPDYLMELRAERIAEDRAMAQMAGGDWL